MTVFLSTLVIFQIPDISAVIFTNYRKITRVNNLIGLTKMSWTLFKVQSILFLLIRKVLELVL